MMSLKICGCWRVPAHNPILPFLQEIGTFYNITSASTGNGEIERPALLNAGRGVKHNFKQARWQDEKHLGALAINMMDGINKEPHLVTLRSNRMML